MCETQSTQQDHSSQWHNDYQVKVHMCAALRQPSRDAALSHLCRASPCVVSCSLIFTSLVTSCLFTSTAKVSLTGSCIHVAYLCEADAGACWQHMVKFAALQDPLRSRKRHQSEKGDHRGTSTSDKLHNSLADKCFCPIHA